MNILVLFHLALGFFVLAGGIYDIDHRHLIFYPPEKQIYSPEELSLDRHGFTAPLSGTGRGSSGAQDFLCVN